MPHHNMQSLINNIQDLNMLSQQLSKDIYDKNQILQYGIKNCENCKKILQKNKPSMIY